MICFISANYVVVRGYANCMGLRLETGEMYFLRPIDETQPGSTLLGCRVYAVRCAVFDI